MRVVEAQAFILGPEVKTFEEEAALAIGTPHAIGCASGTDALLLALMALDLQPGDEVITTPYTFFATAGSIVRLGLKPVFCDIDPATFNLDVARLAELVTSRTRAIMPVHLFGQCAPMDSILALAKEHGLAVIEDAAQAIGARDGGRNAGTMGTIGCFSFFPSKNLGGFGDGGLMTTADPALAKKLKSLRVHGSAERYFHEWVGINSRLDAIQAAVLRVKLPHLEGWSDLRAAHAAEYRRLFAEAGLAQGEGWMPQKGLVVLPQVKQERHVFNQYVIRVHEDLREDLRRYLGEKKIGTAVYYPLALHLQPCFASLGYHEGDLPMAEAASRQTLALPVFPELTPAEQQRVVAAIGKFFNARD
jgi:dTDP-4-amino-4,6-dideoxygalactose transaminase